MSTRNVAEAITPDVTNSNPYRIATAKSKDGRIDDADLYEEITARTARLSILARVTQDYAEEYVGGSRNEDLGYLFSIQLDELRGLDMLTECWWAQNNGGGAA